VAGIRLVVLGGCEGSHGDVGWEQVFIFRRLPGRPKLRAERTVTMAPSSPLPAVGLAATLIMRTTVTAGLRYP